MATVELKFAQQGTQIHYTLNNQLPTEKDKIYTKPIQIKNSFTTIKAMVTGAGFLPSEIVSVTFIKDGLKIRSVQQPLANQRFPGNGANTLIDNEGGMTDLNSKTWLGYQQDSVEIDITMEKKQTISSVLVNCLQDHGSWVFLPEQIRIYYLDDKEQSFQLMAEQSAHATESIASASCVPIMIGLPKKTNAGKIKIKLNGIKSLPEWHPGKGQAGWIFIDEIKVY
jgi:Fn3 associated